MSHALGKPQGHSAYACEGFGVTPLKLSFRALQLRSAIVLKCFTGAQGLLTQEQCNLEATGLIGHLEQNSVRLEI